MQYTCLWYKVQEKYKVLSTEYKVLGIMILFSQYSVLNTQYPTLRSNSTTFQDTDIQLRILLLFGQVLNQFEKYLLLNRFWYQLT